LIRKFLPTAYFVLTLGTSAIAQEADVKAVRSAETATKPAKAQTADFIRLTKSSDGKPTFLETAVISYQSGSTDGPQVDLIGAVHIGERSYYQQLNQLFDTYDVLLYELVAPEGTIVSTKSQEQSSNPISFLQKSMKDFLGMESQLERVDYSKKHFVRADMTPAQISQKMQERGDTAVTLALSTLVDVMREQNKIAQSGQSSPLLDSDLGLLEMLENPQQAKLLMAQQFVATGSLDQALGSSLNQLLVIDRNAEAMRGLQKQLAAGKKKIGIFYGAAHLPDMDQRLINEFGMKRQATQWVKAWDLTSSKGKSIKPMSLMFDLLKQLDP
jgi:hypothetical protein